MISQYLKSLELFLKSAHFFRGIVLTVAVISPLFILNYFGHFEWAPSIVIGAFLNAPADIPGSLKRKVNGILIGVCLTMLVTLLVHFSKPLLPLLLIVMMILSFTISLISVFGFRASLLSFSGLLAMVLAFAIEKETPEAIFTHVGFMGIGGIWYLLVSLALHRILPRKDEDQFLSETLYLIGDYIKLRGELLTKKDKRSELLQKTFTLQTQINDRHESLRELLLDERRRSGRSHLDEKRLLIFISSVDMLELAIANHLDYDHMDTLFADHQEQLKTFQQFNKMMGKHLKQLSEMFIKRTKIPSDEDLLSAQKNTNDAINQYIEALKLPKAREGALLLRNLYDYQAQMLQYIQSISRVMDNVKNASIVSFKRQDSSHFLTLQEYRLDMILQHLSLNSAIFRHALRITFAILFAFVLGTFLDIQNTYWIILTVIVILRPNYGLTKERSKQRIIGTVIGAIVAIGIVIMTQNATLYAILSIVSLTFAFSLIQQNYTSGAAFITISIIFLYGLLHPDAFSVIQYRVIDTVIGAAIAFTASFALWPTWEASNIKLVLLDAIERNKHYLEETKDLYHHKNKSLLKYKVARKQAFLATGNLNAAFQRLMQEPKSKRASSELIYDMVTLNQTFLSATASIGSFIINHQTTPASEAFDDVISKINYSLNASISILNQQQIEGNINIQTVQNAQDTLLKAYQNLSDARDKKIEEGNTEIDQQTLTRLQEAHLIYNQLIWLQTLSDNLKKASRRYQSTFE
ncbi:FUSC family protein [Subsaxibacter sp. CAU 1640]|uniref:FUSC family protein n=1 Tax=Subsaxibacter sp. CAU 1640 TaxID=2933271 RepID=UPI002002FFCC|nr:FUSC family membrane protein [Subsaxibacter sp. CAU 1640]MCK7590011.1 FUSC family protein [Subsaxibacter sp. CAU 1640]